MYVTIGGKRWQIREVNNLGRNVLGLCSDPSLPNKKITLRRGLTEDLRLETLIHEVLHAAAWQWHEEHVDQISREIARILIRQGYRRHGQKESGGCGKAAAKTKKKNVARQPG